MKKRTLIMGKPLAEDFVTISGDLKPGEWIVAAGGGGENADVVIMNLEILHENH